MLWITISSLAVSAVLLSLTVFRHQRVTTALATFAAILELEWMALIWLLLKLDQRPSGLLAAGTALAVGILSAVAFMKFRQRPALHGFGPRDAVVLLTLIPILLGAHVIAKHNGLLGTDFVMHGFYNGDVVTFASLTQQAIVNPAETLSNPFAAGESLEYPTLLHQSLAAAIQSFNLGLDWLHFWPIFTLVQIVITIPLFFLLWDTVLPPPPVGERWLGVGSRHLISVAQGGLVLAVITLSADNFLYPQSHFFLTALFLLLAALLFSQKAAHPVLLGVSALAVLVLSMANAVTGLAALTIFAVSYAVTVVLPGTKVTTRLLATGIIAVLGVLYMTALPGQTPLGLPHFSYTAANEAMRLFPWAALLFLGIALQYQRHPRESLAALALCFVAGVIFLFVARAIIVANASRLIYHALLIGFPLLLRPLIIGTHYLRREFLLSIRTPPEMVVGIALIVLVCGSFVAPNLASTASAFDNLLRQDETIISFQRREALWWIADHTPPASIIVADPHAPWDIPLFTGRRLLRATHGDTAFWLSRDDETLATLSAAFEGDHAAQASMQQRGDYLILSAAQKEVWSPIAPAVFTTKDYTIFQLRD